MTDLSDLAYMRGHLHLTFRAPVMDAWLQLLPDFEDEKAQADIDIKFVDRDGNGEPEVEVRWDLPGTIFDSGEEPRVFPVSDVDLFGANLGDVVSNILEKAEAPLVVIKGIKVLVQRSNG